MSEPDVGSWPPPNAAAMGISTAVTAQAYRRPEPILWGSGGVGAKETLGVGEGWSQRRHWNGGGKGDTPVGAVPYRRDPIGHKHRDRCLTLLAVECPFCQDPPRQTAQQGSHQTEFQPLRTRITSIVSPFLPSHHFTKHCPYLPPFQFGTKRLREHGQQSQSPSGPSLQTLSRPGLGGAQENNP